MTINKPIKITKLSFEDAMGELEEITRALENGDISLDASIISYERGAALKSHCQSLLSDAKMRVEKINIANDGNITSNNISDQ